MYSFVRVFAIVSLAAGVLPAANPVALTRQPQKFRTFYRLDDPAVPATLKQMPPPMPVGGVTAVAVASDGAVWYGSANGLVRYDAKAGERDRVQYFAGLRYLPDDAVVQLSGDRAGGMWARTQTGVSHIEFRSMTLAEKAIIFERRIRARHDRHGMVSPSRLRIPGDVTSNEMRDDDNDGLWTAMYAAAECFRYSVTRSPEALANARKALNALLFLEEVAGKRGFPARSYIEKGEPMPRGGEWHWTEDGKYYWKGDTSSDELVGHFFAFGIATDLLPDAALKARIKTTTARIMDHIISHGYELIDLDGEPTRWGRWSPRYFEKTPEDSSLNATELLSFLKTTAHVTGDARYEREYRKAAIEMGYAQRTTRYKELREELNYSDEELVMLPFYGLFRYEKDAALLDKYYRPAVDQWWENIVREDNPLWTLIYLQGHPGKVLDLRPAVRTLYRMPVDTIEWSVKNSQRADVLMDTAQDRFRRPQAKTLLAPDERPAMKWNSNPFSVDSNSGGRGEEDGTAFLLPYWMGRYHKNLLGE